MAEPGVVGGGAADALSKDKALTLAERLAELFDEGVCRQRSLQGVVFRMLSTMAEDDYLEKAHGSDISLAQGLLTTGRESPAGIGLWVLSIVDKELVRAGAALSCPDLDGRFASLLEANVTSV